jgi:hypothetical protein
MAKAKLSRSRISKDVATIDYLNKRLDVLERLNKLHTQLTEGPVKPFLDTEIEHCQTFLRQPSTVIGRYLQVEIAAHQSPLGRFFLVQPATTARKRIYKGLFYFFFGFSVLAVPSMLINLFSEQHHKSVDIITIMLFSFFFYMGIALLFRRAARPDSQPQSKSSPPLSAIGES